MPNSSELNDLVIRSLKEGINRHVVSETASYNRRIDLDNASNILKRFTPQSISSIYHLVLQNCYIHNSFEPSLCQSPAPSEKDRVNTNQDDMPENVPGRNAPFSIKEEDIVIIGLRKGRLKLDIRWDSEKLVLDRI